MGIEWELEPGTVSVEKDKIVWNYVLRMLRNERKPWLWSTEVEFYKSLPHFVELGDYLYEKSIGTCTLMVFQVGPQLGVICNMGALKEPFIDEIIIPHIKKWTEDQRVIRKNKKGDIAVEYIHVDEGELKLFIPFSLKETDAYVNWMWEDRNIMVGRPAMEIMREEDRKVLAMLRGEK